jgi:bifunctional DNA-binding transcriptional regulator/antitoxin component of YhaV-PrlF toxin-antitoxin module
MNTTIIKSFGSGQITIPKAWRERIKAPAYRAFIKGKTITLSPIKEEDDYGVKYYENKEGFGLRFSKGIPTGELLKRLKAADRVLKKNAKIS